jgi:hypothetical protein
LARRWWRPWHAGGGQRRPRPSSSLTLRRSDLAPGTWSYVRRPSFLPLHAPSTVMAAAGDIELNSASGTSSSCIHPPSRLWRWLDLRRPCSLRRGPALSSSSLAVARACAGCRHHWGGTAVAQGRCGRGRGATGAEGDAAASEVRRRRRAQAASGAERGERKISEGRDRERTDKIIER